MQTEFPHGLSVIFLGNDAQVGGNYNFSVFEVTFTKYCKMRMIFSSQGGEKHVQTVFSHGFTVIFLGKDAQVEGNYNIRRF